MFSGLKRIQTKRRRRSSGPPPPVPRQRVQPIRPERLSQIKGERPARLDLHIDAPKPLRCHIAERRRDELGARRPIRREAPPLVTFADSRPLAEVLGIGHGQVRNRRPELFAPGAGVDIHYGYRPSVQSFELAVIGAALAARRKYKLGWITCARPSSFSRTSIQYRVESLERITRILRLIETC